MTEKTNVSYSYAQQPAPNGISYPSIPPSTSSQQQQPQPPPPQQAFAVGTPAYYPHQQQPPQYTYEVGCCSEACLSLPQVWLFAFGFLLPITWWVAAFFPLCIQLRAGERPWWVANLVMAIVSFTVALLVSIMVPTMAVVHGSGDGMHSTTYVYRG